MSRSSAIELQGPQSPGLAVGTSHLPAASALPPLLARVPAAGPPTSSAGRPPGVHLAIGMQGWISGPDPAPLPANTREIISGQKPRSSGFIAGTPELDLVLRTRDRGGAAVPWWHVSGRNMAHARSTPVSQAFALLREQPNGQTPPARLQQMERWGRLRVCGAGQRSCALELQLMKLIWWADYSCVLVRRWHGAPHCTRHRRKGTTRAPYQAFHLVEWTRRSRKMGFWMTRRRRSPSL